MTTGKESTVKMYAILEIKPTFYSTSSFYSIDSAMIPLGVEQKTTKFFATILLYLWHIYLYRIYFLL